MVAAAVAPATAGNLERCVFGSAAASALTAASTNVWANLMGSDARAGIAASSGRSSTPTTSACNRSLTGGGKVAHASGMRLNRDSRKATSGSRVSRRVRSRSAAWRRASRESCASASSVRSKTSSEPRLAASMGVGAVPRPLGCRPKFGSSIRSVFYLITVSRCNPRKLGEGGDPITIHPPPNPNRRGC